MTTEPIETDDATPAPHAIPRLLPAVRAVWPWLLLAVVAAVGWRELRQVDLMQVRGLLRGTDTAIVALLLAATAANLALAGFFQQNEAPDEAALLLQKAQHAAESLARPADSVLALAEIASFQSQDQSKFLADQRLRVIHFHSHQSRVEVISIDPTKTN